MYIIIIGCDRIGAHIANRLSESEELHNVVVVDNDEASFENLSPEFGGFRILGDAGEVDILKQAGIEKADAVFVATGKDNLNLMIAQVAGNIFDVPCVVAKLFDPERKEIFSSFGIKTISTTKIAVEEFVKEIKSRRERKQ